MGWLHFSNDVEEEVVRDRPRGPFAFAASLSPSRGEVSGSGPSLPIIAHKHRAL